MKIQIYSKSNCPLCDTAKKILNSKGLSFDEIKIDDEALRKEFYEKCGMGVRQMPQIFINDHRVGGIAGLQVALRTTTPEPNKEET